MSRVMNYSDFLKNRYFLEVLELGKEYPDRKTLLIDFIDFYKFGLVTTLLTTC
jgi:hypothetical protein